MLSLFVAGYTSKALDRVEKCLILPVQAIFYKIFTIP